MSLSYMILVFSHFTLILFVFLLKTKKFIKCRTGSRKFHNFQLSFIIAEIVTICMSQSISAFLTTKIFVGIYIASGSLYIVLTMVGELPFVIYLAALLVSTLCLSLAIILTYVGGYVAEESERAIAIWKRRLKSLHQLKYTLAMRPFGIVTEAYGSLRPKLGLTISEDMINNTVSLILL